MRRLGTTDFGDEEIGADDIRYVHHSNLEFWILSLLQNKKSINRWMIYKYVFE